MGGRFLLLRAYWGRQSLRNGTYARVIFFFFRFCSSYYHAVSTPLASNGLRFSVDLNELDGPSRAKKDGVFRVC